MKQFLFSFIIHHGIYVDHRYPQEHVENYYKLVSASSEDLAKQILCKHIEQLIDPRYKDEITNSKNSIKSQNL